MDNHTENASGLERGYKHKIKDSVFTNLFGDPKYLIKLYRALHPEDVTTTEDDLSDITVENILTSGQFNDLGFRVGNSLLILVEHQSTWTVNIIIRILLYLAQTYNLYFTENDIDLYSSKKAEFPKPELYVIYTGEGSPTQEFISLKDEFFGGEDIIIDAKVRVICDGKPGDIINQYVTFTRVLADQVIIFGKTRKAVEETVRICKDKDVLKEYFEDKGKEVIDIMVALYDEQEVLDRHISNKAIEAAVRVSQRLAASQEETARIIADDFKLKPEVALRKVKEFWT